MNVAQQTINGLIIGHAFALVAVGWTLLLGSARLVNFGHGQMYMIGAFVAWWVMRTTGLPYLLAVPCAVLVAGLAPVPPEPLMCAAFRFVTFKVPTVMAVGLIVYCVPRSVHCMVPVCGA